jgi:Rrf2 family protein
VNTVRGRKGGFLLGVRACEITASTVVTALEGPCTLVDCVVKPDVCARSATCATRDIWGLVGGKINEVLSGFTIERLVTMQEEKSEKGTSMYYI